MKKVFGGGWFEVSMGATVGFDGRRSSVEACVRTMWQGEPGGKRENVLEVGIKRLHLSPPHNIESRGLHRKSPQSSQGSAPAPEYPCRSIEPKRESSEPLLRADEIAWRHDCLRRKSIGVGWSGRIAIVQQRDGDPDEAWFRQCSQNLFSLQMRWQGKTHPADFVTCVIMRRR